MPKKQKGKEKESPIQIQEKQIALQTHPQTTLDDAERAVVVKYSLKNIQEHYPHYNPTELKQIFLLLNGKIQLNVAQNKFEILPRDTELLRRLWISDDQCKKHDFKTSLDGVLELLNNNLKKIFTDNLKTDFAQISKYKILQARDKTSHGATGEASSAEADPKKAEASSAESANPSQIKRYFTHSPLRYTQRLAAARADATGQTPFAEHVSTICRKTIVDSHIRAVLKQEFGAQGALCFVPLQIGAFKTTTEIAKAKFAYTTYSFVNIDGEIFICDPKCYEAEAVDGKKEASVGFFDFSDSFTFQIKKLPFFVDGGNLLVDPAKKVILLNPIFSSGLSHIGKELVKLKPTERLEDGIQKARRSAKFRFVTKNEKNESVAKEVDEKEFKKLIKDWFGKYFQEYEIVFADYQNSEKNMTEFNSICELSSVCNVLHYKGSQYVILPEEEHIISDEARQKIVEIYGEDHVIFMSKTERLQLCSQFLDFGNGVIALTKSNAAESFAQKLLEKCPDLKIIAFGIDTALNQTNGLAMHAQRVSRQDEKLLELVARDLDAESIETMNGDLLKRSIANLYEATLAWVNSKKEAAAKVEVATAAGAGAGTGAGVEVGATSGATAAGAASSSPIPNPTNPDASQAANKTSEAKLQF